jgi:zinc transport system permease protein
MSFDVLFDPIFRAPFVTGLLLSAVLPLVGNYVRLRDEWLAALSLAQVAAAGGLIAVLLGQPTMGGALIAAGTTAVLKGRLAHAGNDNYALLVLLEVGEPCFSRLPTRPSDPSSHRRSWTDSSISLGGLS